jgi:hypothetical protein
MLATAGSAIETVGYSALPCGVTVWHRRCYVPPVSLKPSCRHLGGGAGRSSDDTHVLTTIALTARRQLELPSIAGALTCRHALQPFGAELRLLRLNLS